MTQPFHFANGQVAYNAEDLLQLCRQFPHDGVNHLVREDFEKWLNYIGQDDIARCAASARQAEVDDRQKLEEFLTKCHALAAPETKESQESIVKTPVEATPTPQAIATPSVVEPKPQTPSVTAPTPEVKPTPKPQEVATASTEKPSFFKVIARLIINIFYRQKN